ncbi:TPA: hypothetical protein ACH3X1_012996 [Trebouxia sp. C0004]
MQEEYYKLKRAEKANEETMRQLTAQLARTEEAAKRAMVSRDPSAKGGAAQRLLDLECELSRVQADRTELEARYMKEHKRAGDFKTKSEELKRRLDTVLRDQRQLVQRVGNAEARRPRNSPLQSSLKSTDTLMSAAHKQLADQQHELDGLRQELSLSKEAQQPHGPSSAQHHVSDSQTQVSAMQALVATYKQQLGSSQHQILSLEQQVTMLTQQQSEAQKRTVKQPNQLIFDEISINGQAVFVDNAAGKVYTRSSSDCTLHQCGLWSKTTGIELFQQPPQISAGLAQLQRYLTADNSKQLQQAFDQFDTDHLGSITMHSLPSLLHSLLPRASENELQFVLSQLVIQDNDRLTLKDLVDWVHASLQASDAIMTAEAAVPQDFQQLRSRIKQRQQELCDLFGVYDNTGKGTLDIRQLTQLLKRLLSGITDSQIRQLVAKLHVEGVQGTVSLQDLFDATRLGAAPKLHSGMHVRSSVNASPAAAKKAAGELQALRHQLALLKQTAQHHAQACSNKDAELIQMRRAVGQLQQDLHRAKQHQLASPAAASGIQHGTEALEAQIRAAWDKANVLKTRFIETKNAFEQLKTQHARVIQELDTKVQGLHEQRMKQLSLERECSRLRQEVGRLAVLQPLLEAERNDRVRLEKENSSLMAKAFAAPNTALLELRGLKTEVYSLRQDKANAELREAEARRKLADLTSWGSRHEGQPAEMMCVQQELAAAHKLVARLKIELDAAHSRLDIFRSWAPVQTSSQARHDLAGLQAFTATGEDHVRRELASLQSAYQTERLEGDKVRQLLAYEETRRCSLEETLDQAHKHAEDKQRNLQDKVAQLQQESTRLEQLAEHSHRQLVLRAGKQTDSQDGSSSEQQHLSASGAHVTDSIEDLADNENIIEVHVIGAELQCATGANFASFVELNFYEHATQATPVIQGRRPQYDTTVQFVVEIDSFLAEHKDSSCLALRLHRSNGYDYEPLGAACIPLPQLLSSLHLGLNSATHSRCQHAQILGKHGEVLGIVEYAAAIYRPIPSMGQAKFMKAQPGHEMGSTESTFSAVTLQHADLPQYTHFVKPPAKQTFAASTASMASQDSTALSAFHGGTIPAEWGADVGQPQEMRLGGVSDEEADRSLSQHEDAHSLIPSGSDDGVHQDKPEEQSAATGNWQQPVAAADLARTTADSVLDKTLGDIADTAVTSAAQAAPSSRRTTVDSVLSTLLKDVADTNPASAESQASASSSRRPSAGTVLDVELGQTAAPGSALLHHPAGAQPSSTRSTTDSVLDKTLLEVESRSCTVSRQPSGVADTPAAPCDSRRHTADSVLDAVLREVTQPDAAAPQPSTSSVTQNGYTRGMQSSAHPTAAGHMQDVLDQPGHRPTVDSVLDDVLADFEEAEQESVDSLLDEVLDEVAGAASRQRTTADSMLDAMLDDVSTSRLPSQESMPRHSHGHRVAETPHLQQGQAQPVSLQDEQGAEGGSIYSSSPPAMLSCAAQPLSVRGHARYVGTDSVEGLQEAPHTQVCCPLPSADPQDWPDLRSHVVICIESLELARPVQQDPAIQSIFVMYNFLPHFCQSAQEQCTEPAAKGRGALHYNHAVAYAVGQDSSYHLAARQEVQSQLHSPEGAVVPVCLVCDRMSEDTAASEDYHQFGFGEISLQAVLEQDRDLQHHQLPMLDAEQHHVGDLTVSVRAVAAFHSMDA